MEPIENPIDIPSCPFAIHCSDGMDVKRVNITPTSLRFHPPSEIIDEIIYRKKIGTMIYPYHVNRYTWSRSSLCYR